jgi:hypothetical protein
LEAALSGPRFLFDFTSSGPHCSRVESEQHMSTIENKRAWAIAQAGRTKTIAAAKGALTRLHIEGWLGYCEGTKPWKSLVALTTLSGKLRSAHPANYWMFYPHDQPESFDLSEKVNRLLDECRDLAKSPMPRL